jgi:hypothetical protein
MRPTSAAPADAICLFSIPLLTTLDAEGETCGYDTTIGISTFFANVLEQGVAAWNEWWRNNGGGGPPNQGGKRLQTSQRAGVHNISATQAPKWQAILAAQTARGPAVGAYNKTAAQTREDMATLARRIWNTSRPHNISTIRAAKAWTGAAVRNQPVTAQAGVEVNRQTVTAQSIMAGDPVASGTVVAQTDCFEAVSTSG